jgi:lipopolysaccharide assembly protein A
MRVFYGLILLVLLAAITMFAFQNQESVTLRYLDRSVSSPISLLIGGIYFLGMLTGWTFVGMVRRSIHRISERPNQ